MRAAPVAHHDTVKAPLRAENIGQKPLVFGSKCAVDPVIRRHDRTGLSFFYGCFKRIQINLPYGSFVCNRVADKTEVFLIVECKVLQAGTHAHGLHPAHECRTELSRKERVFAVIFKISAAKRVALDVQSGTEKHMHPVIPAFLADCTPDFLGIFGIPGGRHARRRRECGCRLAFGNPVVPAADLLAQSVRSVRHCEAGDIKLRNAMCVHKVRALQKRGLFFFSKFGSLIFHI